MRIFRKTPVLLVSGIFIHYVVVVTDKLVALIRKWAVASIKWRDGPYSQLVKKGISLSSSCLNYPGLVFPEKISFVAKRDDEKSVLPTLAALQVPMNVRNFLAGKVAARISLSELQLLIGMLFVCNL
jgi:hypothetical protein